MLFLGCGGAARRPVTCIPLVLLHVLGSLERLATGATLEPSLEVHRGSLMLRKVLVGRERLVAHTALDVFRGCCTALDVFRGCLVLREVLGSRELTETV